MKVRQEHIKTLTKRLEVIRKEMDALDKASLHWLGVQSDRENGMSDADWAKQARENLEFHLDHFRGLIGDCYDFMSERGLRHYG